jgi:ATP-dependent DNA ligase
MVLRAKERFSLKGGSLTVLNWDGLKKTGEFDQTYLHLDRAVSLACKGVVWTEPQLVAEVDYRGWTADQQLRHASLKGLRQDKDPGR